VLLALVIAALAAAIAILASNDNGSPGRTQAATGESVPVRSGTGPAPTEPTGTNPVPTTPGATTEPTTPRPPAPGTITEWPAGQNGWTIVLASIPQSGGRATALSDARKAISAGLTDVGVLDSSEFSSLHSGYYVVFSGIFNSEQEAKSALDTAKGSYPQSYTRQIVQ
jgi:hypothetical protein